MKTAPAITALMLAFGSVPAAAGSYDELNAGIHFRNLKQWDDAAAALDKALAAGDLLPDQQFVAHLDHGQAELALKRYDLAIADYSAALRLQPGSAAALSQRAVAYLNAGRLTEAADDLDALIVERPLVTAAYSMRAAINARLGKADKSLADSKKILELEPDSGSHRNLSLGIIAWQAGQIDVAQDNFSYAVSHGPSNVYAWLWLALARVRMGRGVPKDDLPDIDSKSWPTPIVDLFTGTMNADAVFAAAGEGDTATVQDRLCEANFYVGEWRLQHHDAAGARPMLQKAASDCPMTFVEWSPAQVELAGLRQ